jgi:hypothetical protein
MQRLAMKTQVLSAREIDFPVRFATPKMHVVCLPAMVAAQKLRDWPRVTV